MANNDVVIPAKATKSVMDIDKAIIKLDEDTLKYEKTLESLFNTLGKQQVSYTTLEKTQKKATEATKKLSTEEKKLEAIEKSLKNNTDAVVKAKILANKETKEQKERIQALINTEVEQLGTEERLLIANKKLRAERKKLITTTVDGKKRQDEINESINENNDLILESSDKLKQNRMQVGGYTDGINAALEGTDKFSGGVTNIVNNFMELSEQEGGLKAFFTTFVQGMKSATKAGLKFIMTPIGAVIFAIVAAIGLFTAAISRNEEAGDKFGKVWAGISNIIDELIARIFKLLGAFVKLLDGDFSGAMEEAGAAVTGLGDAMKYAYNEGSKLQQMQIDIEEATIKTTTAQAKLNKEIERLEVISGDATKSFAVREAAAEKARAAQIELANETTKIAKLEKAEVDLRVAQAIRQGTISRALRQEQADAAAKLIEAEGSLTVAMANNEKERLELKQDRLEKDLDILIDGYDNVKTINERIIASDSQTIEKRQALLDKTTQLGEASFAKQIETLKQFTNVNLDENDLLAEQDAVMLNQKIRNLGLSEIIEGRLLEVIREKRIAAQDLADAQIALDDEVIATQIENAVKLQEEFTAQAEKRIADQEIQAQAELIILKAAYAEGEMTKEEFAAAAVTIEFNKNQKILRGELEVIEQQIANAELTDEVRKSLAQDASALRRQLAEQDADHKIMLAEQDADHKIMLAEQTAEKEAEIEEKLAERKKAIQEGLVQLAQAAGNAIFEFRAIAMEKETAKLAEQKEIEIQRAGEDKDKIAEINKRYEKKENEIKRKKAVNDKLAAMFNIAVSTAVAIASASPVVPLMIFAGVMGALQLALVAAKPIPKFFKGTKSAPDGKISVAEKGMELAHRKTGELVLFTEPTITEGFEGATIYNNSETKAILSGKKEPRGTNFTELINSNNKVAEALASQPIIHFDTSKRTITERVDGYSQTYINRKVIGLS